MSIELNAGSKIRLQQKLINAKMHPRSAKALAYGEKEFDLKNSRKVCAARYPEAQLKVWKGLNHCQRISGDSEAYAEMLREIIEASRGESSA